MMRTKFCTVALVLGLSPLAMFAPAAVAQDRDRDSQVQRDRDDQNMNRQDRDDQGIWGRNNLQNVLHQRVPNSNIAVNFQNNNTVVMTGTAATDRDRQIADQLVRSHVDNARVIDQVTVNGFANGNRDRDRTDADRDRARTDNDRDDRVPRTDNDRDDQVRRNDADRDDHRQVSDNDRDHDKKHNKHKKDKDKDKKDKDDRGDHDSDNRPR